MIKHIVFYVDIVVSFQKEDLNFIAVQFIENYSGRKINLRYGVF